MIAVVPEADASRAGTPKRKKSLGARLGRSTPSAVELFTGSLLEN